MPHMLSTENCRGRTWATDYPLAWLTDAARLKPLATRSHGGRMLKDPFDIAIYMRLFWEADPRTVIEIGSSIGASAVWFSDLVPEATVYSVDIAPPADSLPRIKFLRGDGRKLSQVFSADFLAKLPRPLLVIEDADHSEETTAAVLDFFAPVLVPGEFIVVEDTLYWPGALVAVQKFLEAHAEFVIDERYCDMYGYNLTWNCNGWLRKI